MSKPVVKKPDVGISFPADAKGDRSTTTLGKGVIAAAMRASGSDAGTQFAAQCEKEKNWRFKYNKHYMNLVKVSADRFACGISYLTCYDYYVCVMTVLKPL